MFVIAELEPLTVAPVVTSLLNAFVVTGIQSGLAKLKRSTEIGEIVVGTLIVISPIALPALLLALIFALTPDLVLLPSILRLGRRACRYSDAKKQR
jgi:hypothetical protein